MSRILVVDDSSDLRDLVRAYLQAAGHTVELAYDGEAGLKAAIKEPPDLILTDIQMPRLDGFGLFSAVRSNPRTAGVPVIMLTAHNSREMLVKALRAGVDDFLGKPFNSADLLKTVADRLKPVPASAKSEAPAIQMSAAGSALPKPAKQAVKREVSGSVVVCEVSGESFAAVLKREEVVELLTRFFNEVRELVHLQGGWVVKFMNDRFVAVFDEESRTHIGSHALRALRCALIVVLTAQRLKSWVSTRFPGRSLPELTVGIGLDTGSVEVFSGAAANVGTAVRGQAVDVASFLGLSSRTLAWSIVASRATASHANFEFVSGRGTDIQMANPKGKVAVVEVKGLPAIGVMSPDLQKTYALIEAAVERNNALLASTKASTKASAKSVAVHPGKPAGKAAPARPVADRPHGGVEVEGYNIVRKLAENGLVSVFLAQAGAGERVLKTIRVDDKKKRAELGKLIEDYSVVRPIEHPSVARTFGQGLSEMHVYFAMEYCPGGDLRNSIAERMVTEDVMKTLLRLCVGLKAAHEKGIFHGDLKPANIMIRADGSLAITDFRIANIVENAMGGAEAGVVVRSPHYLSPDLVTGLPADAQSDLYSLGVILHEMLTGQRPYASDDISQVMMHHLNSPVPKLPENLARFQPLLDRMMAKQRGERFGSVQEAITFMARAKIAS